MTRLPNAPDARPAPARVRGGNGWALLLLAAIVLSPPTLVAVGFWAASAPWEFAGAGLKHWVLVKGTTIDRLGLISATSTAVRYVVRIQEGTDPGAITMHYDSDALPIDVIAAYAKRCRTMGLAIKKQAASEGAVTGTLVCEGKSGSDDIWIQVERTLGAATTQVRVIAGPGLTGTYNF